MPVKQATGLNLTMKRLPLPVLALLLLAACASEETERVAPVSPAEIAGAEQPRVSPDVLESLAPVVCDEGELEVVDVELGDGTAASTSSVVQIAYIGKLEDGSVFDQHPGTQSNLAEVILGFSEGIAGMRVGGTRRIVVPPHMAYGPEGGFSTATGEQFVPSCATLFFGVELLGVF